MQIETRARDGINTVGRGKMKTHLYGLAIVLAASICLLLDGCSIKAFARIFNRTNHAITVQQGEKAPIVIASGASAPVPLWASARGQQRGIMIVDGPKALFYALRWDSKANREDTHSTVPILPSVSAKWSYKNGIEYYFEYSANSDLFALVPGDEGSPKMAEPQPKGFPIRPNQTLGPSSSAPFATGVGTFAP